MMNPPQTRWGAWLRGALVIAGTTAVIQLGSLHLQPSDIAMIYLLAIIIVSTLYGRGASLLASCLSVIAFDFFFVPPYFTFAVLDSHFVFTFTVMFIVGIVISSLTARVREQAAAAAERERRTASLYALSQEFSGVLGQAQIIRSACKHIGSVFDSRVVVLLPDGQARLRVEPASDRLDIPEHDQGVAHWVYERGQPAGLGTAILPSARGLYLPLAASDGNAGVIGLYPNVTANQDGAVFTSEQLALMQTFVNQTALALERTILAEKSEQAQLQIETERLRNSLLSSVSHDLRTPLAAITGAVTSLLENDAILKDDERRDLTGLALDAAQRLNRLITNILEVTRLESGGVHVNKEWQMIEEVVGTVLHQLDDRLVGRSVAVRIPHDLPPVPMDAVLIGQVLINLLENALKYTPPGSPLEVAAHAGTGEVMIEVADRGAGLPPGADQHIFEKFYRAQPAESVGVGLGLTICRGIIEAHGGRIWAENRPNGGSVFRFTLPLNNVPVLLDE